MEKTIYRLRTHPDVFSSVQNGELTFIVRRKDRNFAVGDEVILLEMDLGNRSVLSKLTGRKMARTITYIKLGSKYGIHPSYCVLSLSRAGE